MVIGAFPLFKLASVAIKQISRPVASSFKLAAKKSDLFRRYVCIWPGQGYHWLETTVQKRLMGLSSSGKVQPLSEENAVNVGAELLGEGLVFFVMTALIVVEYRKGQKTAKKKEQELTKRLSQLNSQMQDLELMVDTQAAQFRELTRFVHGRSN